MKRFSIFFLSSIILCGAVALTAGESGKKVKLRGTLVDIACASEQKNDLHYLREKHSKGCFQMPACEKSGYALLTADDRVLRFDADGNAAATKMIAASSRDKDFRVKVQGRLLGEQLQVSKLELQK